MAVVLRKVFRFTDKKTVAFDVSNLYRVACFEEMAFLDFGSLPPESIAI
jgi:hypothetical protein